MAYLLGLQPVIIALLSGGTFAGIFLPERNDTANEKLRIRAANKAADNSYAPPKCTPQFPNHVQGMTIEPRRMLGRWYMFMRWYPGITDDQGYSNVWTIYTDLFNGSLTQQPGTGAEAVVSEQHYGAFDREGNQCLTLPSSYLDFFTADGQMTGIGMWNGSSYHDTSLILSTDYDTYALYFQCAVYDRQSDSCASSYPYVQTRDRPDQVSVTTVSKVVDAINQALGRYCFTADLMVKNLWLSDKDCALVVPTDDCYTSVRNAYMNLGELHFSGGFGNNA